MFFAFNCEQKLYLGGTFLVFNTKYVYLLNLKIRLVLDFSLLDVYEVISLINYSMVGLSSRNNILFAQGIFLLLNSF